MAHDRRLAVPAGCRGLLRQPCLEAIVVSDHLLSIDRRPSFCSFHPGELSSDPLSHRTDSAPSEAPEEAGTRWTGHRYSIALMAPVALRLQKKHSRLLAQ